jgi:hypothetical protein
MVSYARQRAVLFSAILRFSPEGFKDIDELLVAVPGERPYWIGGSTRRRRPMLGSKFVSGPQSS